MQPLAAADRSESNTNLSTSISLSILDRDGNELSLPTTLHQPYRFLIPRDPNVIIPSMVLQNVTSMNSTPHSLLSNLHYVDILQSNNSTVFVHIEMQPLNTSLAYLFIYKFDHSPQLNSSVNSIDGWTLFCPSSSIHTYFLDNQQTKTHQSLIFALRELNCTELAVVCANQSNVTSPPIPRTPFHFTADYRLRIYTSDCYYLDANNHWQSDGLVVSISRI